MYIELLKIIMTDWSDCVSTLAQKTTDTTTKNDTKNNRIKQNKKWRRLKRSEIAGFLVIL